MSTITIEPEQLKALMKSAVLEAFDERHAQMHDDVEEVIEDLALIQAMDEVAGSPTMSVEEFYQRMAAKS